MNYFGSHGCVRLTESEAAKMFDWTLQADYVHWRVYHDWIRTDDNLVYDPSTSFDSCR